MKSTPQIDTLLKELVPLGYTLEIVPLNKHNEVKSHGRTASKT